MAQRKFIIDGGFKTDDASELLANLTMGGTIDMDNDKILNLGTPTDNTDAATKAYVDTTASTAQSNAESTASADATTKADAAVVTAAADATSKADQALVDAKAYTDTAETDAVATAATAAQVKVDALETSLTHFHSAVTDITDASDNTYTFSELTNARHYAVFINRMILRANEYSVSGTTVTLVSGTHDVGDELEVTGFSS
jgi:hypothetical protein